MVLLRKAWLVGLVLSSVLAHADTDLAASNFSGHWSGQGRIIQKNAFFGSTEGPCSLIDVTVEHLPARITIQRYHAICGVIDSDWGPHALEVQDGKIFEDGEETGTFDGDILKTLQRSGGVLYAFNLRVAGGALETYYGVRNAAGSMVIEGNLSPAR